MESLLRARDIETRILKKVALGGYSMPEVDEFLDQISEDLEIYVKRIEELERKIIQLETKQKEHEDMKDSIQETLLAAHKAAKQIVLEGQRVAKQTVLEGQRSVAENEAEAENILNVAREERQRITHEGEKVLIEAREEHKRIIQEGERILNEARKEQKRITLEGESILKRSQFEREQIIKDAENEAKKMKNSIVQLKEESLQFIYSNEKYAEEYISALSKWRENIENY